MPQKLSIEDMQRIAMKYRGKCLSKNYIDSSTKLLWECAAGHQWEARPNDVKNNGTDNSGKSRKRLIS
jgi:hypothetical protein